MLGIAKLRIATCFHRTGYRSILIIIVQKRRSDQDVAVEPVTTATIFIDSRGDNFHEMRAEIVTYLCQRKSNRFRYFGYKFLMFLIT